MAGMYDTDKDTVQPYIPALPLPTLTGDTDY